MIRKQFSAILPLIAVVVFVSLSSCNPATKYVEEEEAQIQDYLSSNSNLNFVKQASGLYYLEVEEGAGRQPITSDTAYLKYTGKFLDGRIFDTNLNDPGYLIIPVNEGYLIPGFDEGITHMKEGGKALLLVPSALAYGPSGYYGIPSYSPLLFNIELVTVKPGPSL